MGSPANQGPERGQGNGNPVVGAVSAEQLTGPWVVASIKGVHLAMAIDTFCPENLISLKLAKQLGGEMTPTSSDLSGLGGAPLGVLGETVLSVQLGTVEKDCVFRVVGTMDDFAFMGWKEQQAWGMDLSHSRQVIGFQGQEIPFACSFSRVSGCAAAVHSGTPPQALEFTVKLAVTTIVPAGAHLITLGEVVGQDVPTEGYLKIDPVVLTKRYGMLSPRALVAAGKQVPVVIRNPLPVDVKLFRCSEVGTACYAEVDDSKAAEMCPGSLSDPSPDAHPVDVLKSSLEHLTPAQRKVAEEMLLRRHKAISRGDDDFGLTDWVVHDIQLKEGQETPSYDPQRTTPYHKREKVDAVVEDLLDKGIIEPAQSPWRSHALLVKKKALDGSWLKDARFCLDLRSINAKTVRYSRLIPKVSEVIDQLQGSEWFSKIDLVNAYHQIPLTSSASDKTAFTVFGGKQYRYSRLCFGLCNAGNSFADLMDLVLSGLSRECAMAYLDDTVVFSKTFEDHVRDLDDVLMRFEAAGLKAKPSKCSLFQSSIELLGHRVSGEGIAPEDFKVKTVQKWPQPENLTALRGFLSFCSYYRRSIPHFSSVAWPLNKLTHNEVIWRWGEVEEAAFQELKRLLTSAPVMALPDLSRKFYLDTDWSRTGIGWTLAQEGPDGRLKPVLYGSRSLSKAEAKYGSTKGEFLGMFEAIHRCRPYLLGSEFVVRCDNRALSFLKNYRDLTHRTARMLEMLADYSFKVQFISGKKNVPADILSRIEWPYGECPWSQVDTGGEEVVAPVVENAEAPGVNAKEPVLDWAVEQGSDEDIGVLKDWLQFGVRPPKESVKGSSAAVRSYWANFEQFELRNGIICRVWTDEGSLPDRYLKVVPTAWRKTILQGHHEDLGHIGCTKMKMLLRSTMYWFGMSSDIDLWVQACKVCRRRLPGNTRAPLVQEPEAFFGQKVYLDLKGPLGETRRGNKWYLVVIDGFSKWTELLPLEDAEATTVYSAFYNGWVCRHGVPVQLHSDHGSNLVGTVGQIVADLLNMYRTKTTSYHPMGNGAAERAVRNSIKMIAAILAQEDPLDWDISCAKAALAINVTPSTTTLHTPWLIKHSSCTEAVLPISILTSDLPVAQDVDVVVRDLQERQKRMFRAVSHATGLAQNRQKGYYDLRVKGPEIQVGDSVVYEDKTNLRAGEIRSLRLPFKAPLFQVVEKLSDVNYRIASDGGQGKIVHYNQLRKVEGPDRAPGEETIPAAGQPDEAAQPPLEPRKSGRIRKRPERLGADTRDPDVPWIP